MQRKPLPPRIFLRFFRWFCHPDLVDFIEGDLMELYEERIRESGETRADTRFIMDVLLLCRPSIIRPLRSQKNLITFGMYKNHFKVGLRNIVKQKVFFLINTIGLSTGLMCFAFIALWVNDELRYDTFNKNYDRIVRVVRTAKTESGIAESAGTGAPIAQVLKNDFPEVQQAVRLDMRGDIITHQGQQFHQQGILLVDPAFFDIFSYTLSKGNPATALNEPFTLILTESASRKYFGDSDPIGETLTINLHDSTGYGALYKITGVMPDPPLNAHFTFTMIASFKTIEVSNPAVLSVDGWGDTSFYTYLLLKEGVNQKVFEEKIAHLYGDYIDKAPSASKRVYSFDLQPLHDIYLRSHLQNEIATTGNINQVYLFSAIGIFILVLAGINYVNLATASSVKRAKEVGIKKVIGAYKGQLIAQYLCESVLTTLISFVISLLLCSLLQPAFFQLTGKNVQLLSSPILLALITGVSLLLGIVSGLYPAVVLSGFRPVRVLKGNYRQGKSGVLLRKSLVVAQFTTTIVFITGIIVVNSQLSFIRNKDLGFNKDVLLFLRIHGNTDVIKGYNAFKNDLLSNPIVHSAATSNTIPLGGLGKEEAETADVRGNFIQVNTPTLRIDSDYLNVYGLKLVAGRNFHSGIIRDTIQPVILNEAAVKTFGWESSYAAIGKPFKIDGKQGEVIGVVKNFHFSSLHERIEPLAMYPVSQRFSRITLNADVLNSGVTTAWVERVWKKHFPSALLDYSFVDAQVGGQYLAEQRFSKILMYSSIMSLLIACLGLYGLILHAATQKVKEIGIRKVLGASVNGIAVMLSKDFFKLIVISMFIAIPIAWYTMSSWLENFAYQIAISAWMFGAAGLIVVIIAVATISLEAIKAGLTNPVKSLRSE
jgi:putative ABC transport system permease protein